MRCKDIASPRRCHYGFKNVKWAQVVQSTYCYEFRAFRRCCSMCSLLRECGGPVERSVCEETRACPASPVCPRTSGDWLPLSHDASADPRAAFGTRAPTEPLLRVAAPANCTPGDLLLSLLQRPAHTVPEQSTTQKRTHMPHIHTATTSWERNGYGNKHEHNKNKTRRGRITKNSSKNKHRKYKE